MMENLIVNFQVFNENNNIEYDKNDYKKPEHYLLNINTFRFQYKKNE